MDPAERQFVYLTQLVLDGIATEAERAELALLSAARPELVTSVADELVIDSLIKWQSGSIGEGLPLLEYSDASRASSSKHATRQSVPMWTWVIAATMLVATGMAAWKYASRNIIDTAIADIVYQQGVIWTEDSSALGANDTIQCGRLSSSSGEYTLQFRNGSTLQIVGPASLDIKSKMLVQLDQGQATASVPQNSIGFTISSAMVDVVDQGTQFGISVDNGRADVVVFDGKVDVKSNLDRTGSETRLTQGDAVKVNRQGSFDRLVDIRRDIQGRWWSGDRSDLNKHVIASVSDNIHDEAGGGDTFVCYQTTFEGLEDDAIAYSDNPYHQWNGLTADGIPDFLRGADYIRTFNDYRYMDYFEMKVELARPANLYVFFDNRVDPPEWLKAGFEDTGFDIGLDEGPWLLDPEELTGIDLQEFRKLDVNKTAVGGGKSVDNVFSVWRRRCVDGGTVSLGHAGGWIKDGTEFRDKGGRSMYGIAATPLGEENATDRTSN